jgi:hypothetical protein
MLCRIHSIQCALNKIIFCKRVQGLPLSLNGVKRIMASMDWGDAQDFVTVGAVGAEEVRRLRLTEWACNGLCRHPLRRTAAGFERGLPCCPGC